MRAVNAIDRRAMPATLTRRAAGSYNANGEFVAGAAASMAVSAVVQPATGLRLMDLPEGLRTEAGYVAWTRSDIALDDVITSGGRAYRVLFVWPRTDGGFYRAAMGLLP